MPDTSLRDYLAYSRRPHPNQISLGRHAEQQALASFGGTKTKRYIKYVDKRGKVHRRKHDLEGARGRGPGHFMEVKAGVQGLTWRVRRQVIIDMRLVREGLVDDIEWVFYVRNQAQPRREISADLLQFLDDCGIKYRFEQLR